MATPLNIVVSPILVQFACLAINTLVVGWVVAVVIEKTPFREPVHRGLNVILMWLRNKLNLPGVPEKLRKELEEKEKWTREKKDER